jgi:hypothetical protein
MTGALRSVLQALVNGTIELPSDAVSIETQHEPDVAENSRLDGDTASEGER